MKKISSCAVAIAVGMVLSLLGTSALAGKWQKYDDFDSGVIDTQKWIIDDSSATITVEDGKAKFVFPNGGQANDSNWLEFNICPENIVGIKATFTLDPACKSTGVRARIAGHDGTYDDYYSWTQLALEGKKDHIWTALAVLDQDADYSWLYDLFVGSFRGGLDLTDGSYTASMLIDKKKKTITFSVDGQGQIIYDLPQALSYNLEIFKGIGLRSRDNKGPCSFYVDDVYVMRSGKCDKKAPKVKKTVPKKKARKVSRDLEWIEITFSETMVNAGWEFIGGAIETSGGWDVSDTTQTLWSNENKTFRFTRDNAGPLPADTQIEITLNPVGVDWFQDLTGNKLKSYTFKFTTSP